MLRHLIAAPLPRSFARGSGPLAEGVPAVVLAAGEGRRLRPLTDTVAKPLVPVLNVPLLYWTARSLRDAGTTRVVINTHARAPQLSLAAVALTGTPGLDVRTVREPELSGPAGGLAACRAELPTADCYLVLSGDALTDVDLADLVRAHRSSGADLTILATGVPDPQRFGVLELRGSRVVCLREKPADPPPGAVVSCGVYVIGARALSLLDPADHALYDFKDVLPALLSAGLTVRAEVTRAGWSDIGHLDAFHRANLRALDAVPDQVATEVRLPGGTAWIQGSPSVSTDSVLRGSLIGDAATVGAGARLHNSVVGTGAWIGPGARVTDSVVLPGGYVAEGRTAESEVVL